MTLFFPFEMLRCFHFNLTQCLFFILFKGFKVSFKYPWRYSIFDLTLFLYVSEISGVF